VETYSTQVSSIVLPVLLVMILAYYAASIFLSIFDAAVDTIFICFLLDEEKNGNSGRMLASRNLQDIIGAVSVETKSGGEAEMAKD
jgi:choline transporter-like protein 2/4/5